MIKQNILVGLIALILGFFIGRVFIVNQNAKQEYQDQKNMSQNKAMNGHAMDNVMSGMTQGLSGKTGDEFDKAFLTEMIIHHQGAIDMANQVLKSANHNELKDLAGAIISAQSAEIKQMKEWQLSWYNVK
jgi:uncharacterized protein (DUF305 family)